MLNFRRVFSPTKEKRLSDIERIKKIHEEMVNRPQPELETSKHSDILLISTPFEPFAKDCTHCLHYWEHGVGFVEGGYCNKNDNMGCGWGFTCKDWEEKINFDKWYAESIQEIINE